MRRPTLASFRAQWPQESLGICQADPQVRSYCNDAQERLLMDPMQPAEGWWGGWVTLALTASVSNGSAYVTVPYEIARLIVLGICKTPIHIRNGFYEYLNYGDGLQPKTCAPNCGTVLDAYERDNVATLSPMLSTAQTIRIYSTDNRDIGKRVLIQGKDANGMTVLTTDPISGKSAPGEYLNLAYPFVDSVNTFLGDLTGIQKDETYGPVQFFQVDPSTGVETTLSVMQPTEAAAAYRRYLISSIPSVSNICCSTTSSIQIDAQGKLDFIPVQNETDYLLIPNIPALIEECMSIRFSRMDSSGAVQQSAIHHARALALLNGQLDTYQGKTSTAVKVPIWGSNKLTRQPV